jgi:hypothetical protein
MSAWRGRRLLLSPNSEAVSVVTAKHCISADVGREKSQEMAGAEHPLLSEATPPESVRIPSREIGNPPGNGAGPCDGCPSSCRRCAVVGEERATPCGERACLEGSCPSYDRRENPRKNLRSP